MEINKNSDVDKPSYLRVYLAVIATCFLQVSTGIVSSWASPIIPKLNLTSGETSLVTSLPGLGAATGPFVITLCLDSVGRKGTLYVLWLSFVVSWVLILISKQITIIYIARLVSGIGVGAACSAIPIYVSEVALTEIRGPLGATSLFFLSIGVLLTYEIGPNVDYYILGVFGLVASLLFIVVFYFVPESPYYYLKKGRHVDAKQSLQRLRGYKTLERLDEEIKEIENSIRKEEQIVVNAWKALKSRVALKAIGISIYLLVMQQFTASGPLIANAETIFTSTQLSFPVSYVTVTLAIANLFCIAPMFLKKFMTIRFSMLLSGFGTGIFMILFGLYFYLLNDGIQVANYSYLSVVAVLISVLFSCIGVLPLAWPLAAEMMPISVKGVGTGICGCISSLLAFACTALFTIIADQYGFSTVFFGFGALMILSTIGAIFIVPDTTGKTFQEIQEMLEK